MPKIKQEHRARTQLYSAVKQESHGFSECSDCTVNALCIATGVTYAKAHEVLESLGRKHGRGFIFNPAQQRAFAALGFTTTLIDAAHFIRQYPAPHCNKARFVTTHHPERFKQVWQDGKTYIMYVKGHVLPVVNGVVHDWSRGKAMRVKSIYEVTRIGAPQEVIVLAGVAHSLEHGS